MENNLPNNKDVCPNCGYCPHCGKSNQQPIFIPAPTYPIYPNYTGPWYPQQPWTITYYTSDMNTPNFPPSYVVTSGNIC